ncbi:polysaccharide deacetylase family protein [Floridanema evergladense]|uniref:Polysaccharide deacetylase family protein n=1 Tax=Floridaenema evergladense BLCC-F167 TaxID=3153639 RepID=A0ABV4WNT6_9CYAN
MLVSFIRNLSKNKLFKPQVLVRKEVSFGLFTVFVISCLISIGAGNWFNAKTSGSKSLQVGNLEPDNQQWQGPRLKMPTIQAFLPYPIANTSRLKLVAGLKNLETELETSLKNSTGEVIGLLNASPWPEIHDRARMAKVPVLMYHDILPRKEVFFDVTPQQLEAHFQLIKAKGATPVSLDQLIKHLQTGMPLPEKPVILTFDDGYGGHYKYVYPLLKKYGYPAVFSIYTAGVGNNTGRSHVSWQELRQMAADPLVTIAAHSLTHPPSLTTLSDGQLQKEVIKSKQILQNNLGIPIKYFTYPSGKYDPRVEAWVKFAKYQAALTMDDSNEQFAGESKNLLGIARFGQSKIKTVLKQAWGGPPLPPPRFGNSIDFTAPISKQKITIDRVSLVLISGGKPTTIHANKRDTLQNILEGTDAVAAVDGAFFSLRSMASNEMIGPIFSHNRQQFIPSGAGELPRIAGRPLVLIGSQTAKFTPFNPNKHNSLAGIRTEMSSVTDAFVAAAWLVKNGEAQSAKSFNKLFGFDAARHRAFWGFNQAGQPMIGISKIPVDSVKLGAILVKAGFQDAVMLDSGASTSLVYQGKSLVEYTPRPVPHVVALLDPASTLKVSKLDARQKSPQNKQNKRRT